VRTVSRLCLPRLVPVPRLGKNGLVVSYQC